MGVACHIYSAAQDGPRGRGDKDEAFIKSEENGIWCCQYHAALIDKRKGIDYPAPMLFAWKKLAEARTLKKMNDTPSPLGWVDSIEFSRRRPAGRPNSKISLSKSTIITGMNGSGRTALLEAAAAICNSKYFNRVASSYTISNGKKIGVKIEANIIYSTVDALSKELNITADNFVIKRKEYGISRLLPPGDIEVIFCSEDDSIKRKSEDDINFLMRALNVDESALREIVELKPYPLIDGDGRFRNEMDEDDFGNTHPLYNEYGKQRVELVLTRVMHGETFDVTYTCLSSSEQYRLLLSLSITKAREVAKQKLTLLAIEVLAINFDEGNFSNLLRVLSREDFQVLVSLPPYREKSITEAVDGNRRLRDLDYLRDWTLQKI